MKTKIKILIKSIFLLGFLALMFASCRSEVTEIIDNTQDSGLKANSVIANLMNRTSLSDGSIDNVIDSASCFKIKLPFRVIVNGSEIAIETESDYEVVESVFDEDNNDVDSVEIIFPVTIILSDFTEIVVNNIDELKSYIDDDCNDGIDDDIECLDFVYPITASIFNTNNELLETVTINNDSEMHDFIEDLDDDIIVNINFPITIILYDGNEMIINSLDELKTAIENVEDDCDEDDDNDFDDDDNNDVSNQEFSDLLMSCPWKVDELKINSQDFENLKNTMLTFLSNGIITAELDTITSNGTWSVSSIDSVVRVNIVMDSLSEFYKLNNDWRLHKIEPEDDGKDKIDLRIGAEDELELIKSCN